MVSEKELYGPLEALYFNQGYIIFTEVPMLTRKIDMVGITPEKSKIIAIEIKIEKWKEALRQAISYRLCADEVYVALWHEYVPKVDLELFDEFGVGLLEVNGTAEIIQDAKVSNRIQQSVRFGVETYLRDNWLTNGVCKLNGQM